jgi:hypothetical protein
VIHPAIRTAVAAYRDPANVGRHARAALPDGMEDLIALLVASDAAVEAIADDLDVAAAELRQAARFFMVHAVCHAGADDFRLIGCVPGDSPERMRRNRRLLLMWLHPDAGRFDGGAALYQRLNEAWRRIEAGAAIVAEPARVPVSHPSAGRRPPPRGAPSTAAAGVALRPTSSASDRSADRGRARKRGGHRRRRRSALTLLRTVLVATFGLVAVALCAVVLMDVAATQRRCPAFLSKLPFCQFEAADDSSWNVRL